MYLGDYFGFGVAIAHLTVMAHLTAYGRRVPRGPWLLCSLQLKAISHFRAWGHILHLLALLCRLSL